MDTASVKLLQQRLADAGLYAGRVDGRRGPATAAAVAAALAARAGGLAGELAGGLAGELPGDWPRWPDRRKAVACLQLFCREAGIDAGPIDGWWGSQTDFAVGALRVLAATGAPPPAWRDAEGRPRVDPNGWPREDEASLSAFFGPNGLPGGRSPAMAMVECPWTLKIAWNHRQTTRRIGCNAKVADSLGRVLAQVRDAYGDADIRRLHLDLFGGCYNPRRKRGGTSWSTHAWAIALDWNPDANKLEWGRDRATFARPEYDEWWRIWESEGWTSLGRERNFDWMHVQATAV